ncbi:MAG: hypothetical protein KAJ10_15625 [Thermodesulfovibrionia bacterium]|nr:hypothetical protein [Thermodesulfovibrionia bacterium]
MSDFKERKTEAIKKKHQEAINLMLKAKTMDYPACISFLTLATVALTEANAIAAKVESSVVMTDYPDADLLDEAIEIYGEASLYGINRQTGQVTKS